MEILAVILANVMAVLIFRLASRRRRRFFTSERSGRNLPGYLSLLFIFLPAALLLLCDWDRPVSFTFMIIGAVLLHIGLKPVR